jgi:hypothetical protein
MILLGKIIDRIKSMLDAEGADFYLNNLDYIPAINAAVEWVVSVVSPIIGKDKFIEERMSDLHMNRIWQTSAMSRVKFDPIDLKGEVWTITSVFVTPTVYIPTSNAMKQYHPLYRAQIQNSIGKEVYNAPIVNVHWSTGAKLRPEQSCFRPEMAYSKCDFQADRSTVEENQAVTVNPFVAGYDYKKRLPLMSFSYFPLVNYATEYLDKSGYHGGYQVTNEIDIHPHTPRQLMALSFIKKPNAIPTDANADTTYIEFPDSLSNIIAEKALNFIAYKQGDGTNIYAVTTKDLMQLLTG